MTAEHDETPIETGLPDPPRDPASAEVMPPAYEGVPLPGADPLRPPEPDAPDDAALFDEGDLPPRRPETDEERRKRSPVYRVEELRTLHEVGKPGHRDMGVGEKVAAWVVLGDEIQAGTQQRAIEIATAQTGGVRGGTFAVTLAADVTVHRPSLGHHLDWPKDDTETPA